MPNIALDQRNHPIGRDVLNAKLLVEIVVPHVARIK